MSRRVTRQRRHRRARILHQCRRHLELARPLLIVIGGAPGTGKTTLAARLADTMGWVHLRSEEVRRDVAAMAREH